MHYIYFYLFILVVLEIALLLWAYRSKHPVLMALIVFVMTGYIVYQTQSSLTLINWIRMKTKTESLENLFHEELQNASLLLNCRPNKIQDVSIGFNKPVTMIYHLYDRIYFMTISLEGPFEQPKLQFKIRSVPFSLDRETVSTSIAPFSASNKDFSLFINDSQWTCLVFPIVKKDEETRLRVTMFDKPQSNEFALRMKEYPELLNGHKDIFFMLNLNVDTHFKE